MLALRIERAPVGSTCSQMHSVLGSRLEDCLRSFETPLWAVFKSKEVKFVEVKLIYRTANVPGLQ